MFRLAYRRRGALEIAKARDAARFVRSGRPRAPHNAGRQVPGPTAAHSDHIHTDHGVLLLPTRSGSSCRFCGAPLKTTFVDLGMSPLCQTHIAPDQLNQMEPFYPLHAYVCESCFLVQLQEFVAPDEIFTEYAYFSSYSASWVEHARRYVDADERSVRARS